MIYRVFIKKKIFFKFPFFYDSKCVQIVIYDPERGREEKIKKREENRAREKTERTDHRCETHPIHATRLLLYIYINASI